LANRRLFAAKIYEEGDAAANSILIEQAKHGALLVGNYSRLEFNHPGPGILYILAASEILFHDWLPLVPAPHNAHILGSVVLSSILVSLCLTMLAWHWKSWPAITVGLAVFLGFFGWNGFLACHWFPAVYVPIFLTFVIAAASIAAGGLRHLPWLALAGSLAIHGHVCFVLFVLPISLAALVVVLAKYRFRGRRLLAENRRAWIGLGSIAGLFVLPILLHTALDYPGEIGKYLAYARAARDGGHDPSAALDFLVRCLTNDAPHCRVLALALVVAACFNLPKRVSGDQWEISRSMAGAAVLTTGIYFYYACRGVDDLAYTYVGYFFGTVLLIVVSTCAMNVAVLLSRNAHAAGLVVLSAGFIGGYALATGKFTNNYTGEPAIPAFVEAVERSAPADARPLIVSSDPVLWPYVAGFVVEMERRGKSVYVMDDSRTFLFTKRFTQFPPDLFCGRLRRVDITVPAAATARVIAGTDKVVLQEFDTSYRLGSDMIFDDHARAFTLRGWEQGGIDGKWTVGTRAEVALSIDPIRQDVELSVTADGFVTDRHPQTLVTVVVNDQVVGEWVFRNGESCGERRAVLSPAIVNRGGMLRIVFETPDACSPAELGISRDPRKLAMNVRQLRLREVSGR
jgi:hypothetical protein